MTAAVMDVRTEGMRQLERAERLLDVGSNVSHLRRMPVHKSLEQLFNEARARSQTLGSQATGTFASTSLPRLLQTQKAQRLERDISTFSLATLRGAGSGGAATFGDRTETADKPSLGLSEFFGLRHERVILEAVEEAQRDCLRSCERHSWERLQADWEESKAQLLLGLQQLGESSGSLAMCSDGAVSGQVLVPPPQDAPIIDAMLSEPMSQQLVQKIGQLSCESCPPYQAELQECWSILGHELKPTLSGITTGAIGYLQNQYMEEVKSFVFNNAANGRLGGIPDAWAQVCALGRLKFEAASFPSSTTHVWYAAFVAARAGIASLLLELPQRAAPCSDRCPLLRPVCVLMARRLQCVTPSQTSDFAGGVTQEADPADLLRADLGEDSSEFQEVLVSLLLGRSFAFGRLPEGTVKDWLWYRLHAVHLAAKDDDQSPEFKQQLEDLRQRAASLPPSHFDAGLLAGSSSALGERSIGVGAMQTLNSVKVLLLTGQLGQALQQLQTQDRRLRGAALHMALVLQRAGTLEAVSSMEPRFNVSAFLRDYAGRFASRDQLQYLRALKPAERVEALQKLLLHGGAGASDELLGFIDPNGRHRPGLLERTLQEDGMGDQAEFVDLCARAGHAACQQGQYREALRLLHLGRCYSEVLQVLCRCLRLPIWREESSTMGAASQSEAAALAQDIQRFFDIYERNLDRYALSSQVWAGARQLYAARMFHAFCDRGQPEAALDIFDRQQLLPFAGDGAATEARDEIWAEYPRIVQDYVRVLQHAASRGAVTAHALQERLRQLQSFLAARCNRLVLDQETSGALAKLAMSC